MYFFSFAFRKEERRKTCGGYGGGVGSKFYYFIVIKMLYKYKKELKGYKSHFLYDKDQNHKKYIVLDHLWMLNFFLTKSKKNIFAFFYKIIKKIIKSTYIY